MINTAQDRLFAVPEAMPPAPSAKEADDYSDWKSEILPTNGHKLEVVVDEDRIDQVLGTLVADFQAKRFPYNLDSVRLPHDPRHMPENLPYGGVEHAMFLFSICYYMSGGVKSVSAVQRMAEVYEDRPELFIPSHAESQSEEEIASTLKKHGLGFQETVSSHWVENARRMQERWQGDPRKIFAGVDSYETCLQRIQNDGKGEGFLGFQEKMTSMITYYLMDEGLIEPFVFPVPVDLHVLRVSIANQLIRFPNVPHGTNLYTDDTLATLRGIYYDYALRHGVDPLRLCDAVWLLSESMCGKHPGNVTLEPKGRVNRNGRSTVLVPKTVDPDDEKQRQTYADTCAKCPLESTCAYNVPGKPYYVSGVLITRGEREVLPPPAQATIFEQ